MEADEQIKAYKVLVGILLFTIIVFAGITYSFYWRYTNLQADCTQRINDMFARYGDKISEETARLNITINDLPKANLSDDAGIMITFE